MFAFDPLAEASEHGRRLRAEAEAERLVRPFRSTTRHALACALRGIADRLDRAVVVPIPSHSSRW